MIACRSCRVGRDEVRSGFVAAVVVDYSGAWRLRLLRRESRTQNRPSGGIGPQAASIFDGLVGILREAAAEVGEPALIEKVQRMTSSAPLASAALAHTLTGRLAFGELASVQNDGRYRLRCPYCSNAYGVLGAEIQDQLLPHHGAFVAPGSRRRALELWVDESGTPRLSGGPQRAPHVPLRAAKGGL
jgi:hypothetical protein